MEAERDRLHGELQDLNGRGGQLKLQKAMQAAVNARKEVERQLAEQAEAKQQAETMVRQERVDRMADAFAKRHRTAV
jgi:hypothetical protein